MENIYNAIQNVYNMDKTTWQEVLAELYNLVSKVENKFDLFENKFGPLLGEEVTIKLKKMNDDGSYDDTGRYNEVLQTGDIYEDNITHKDYLRKSLKRKESEEPLCPILITKTNPPQS